MRSLGSLVRRAFGPHERQVAELYRRVFVDLDEFASLVQAWVKPDRVLEIGCGEGALAERIARSFPHCYYLGIDIIPQVGRLYSGTPNQVRFSQITAEKLAISEIERFDVVFLSDVIHHVPVDMRSNVLLAAKSLLKADGKLVFKDWARRSTLIHALTYVADVYIGGDKNVRYLSLQEQRELIEQCFGVGSIECEGTVGPWEQNHVFLVARSKAA